MLFSIRKGYDPALPGAPRQSVEDAAPVGSAAILGADCPGLRPSLAVAPGELIMPEGATNRTLDQLAAHGVTWTTLPYGKMQLNGGGIHCSTTPLIRDPV